MNKTQIKHFIFNFLEDWKNGKKEKVKGYYHHEVVAYADFIKINIVDIMKRFDFAHSKISKFEYDIKDIFIDPDECKVAIRMIQRIKTRENEEKIYNVIALYKINKHKIVETYMSFNPNVNYINNSKLQ